MCLEARRQGKIVRKHTFIITTLSAAVQHLVFPYELKCIKKEKMKLTESDNPVQLNIK